MAETHDLYLTDSEEADIMSAALDNYDAQRVKQGERIAMLEAEAKGDRDRCDMAELVVDAMRVALVRAKCAMEDHGWHEVEDDTGEEGWEDDRTTEQKAYAAVVESIETDIIADPRAALRPAAEDAYNAINDALQTLLVCDHVSMLRHPQIVDGLHRALNGLKCSLHQNDQALPQPPDGDGGAQKR